VSSDDRAVIDRLRATTHLRSDAPPDATIRPAHEAQTLAGGRKRTSTITGPFLPSITLSEATTDGTAAAPSADLLVTSLLGEGGMGVVHMATQRSLDRSVAVKRPLESGESLVEEARTMARVEHPNVVPVHALGRDARDRPVLVMKRVQGASFRDLLRDEAHASWPTLIARWGDRDRAALGILGEVADALELAHARGIVHRDVKPENVMVGEFGEVYLLDWGIARRLDQPAIETGSIVGTPGYMAPEMVASPDDVDARTDVYLLGATLHEILTHTLRHRGSSLYETLGLALESAPITYDASVPEDLAALANAATQLDRSARPKSAAAFRTALREHERHREALGMVQDARAAMAPLADGTIPVADERAMPLLAEAGASIAAALRAHPDGASIRAAREEHLVMSIERDLAIESPAAARAHLGQLSAARADLAQRITELEEKLARARSSAAALAELDTSSTIRLRTLALLGAFVPIVAATLLVRTTGILGGAVMTPESMVWTDRTTLALVALGLWFWRARMFANRGNRNVSWFGLVGFAAVAVSNQVGLAMGETVPQALAHTYVLLAYGFAVGSIWMHPRFVLGSLTSFAIACLLVAHPEHVILLSTTGMIAVLSAVVGGVVGYAQRQARQ